MASIGRKRKAVFDRIRRGVHFRQQGSSPMLPIQVVEINFMGPYDSVNTVPHRRLGTIEEIEAAFYQHRFCGPASHGTAHQARGIVPVERIPDGWGKVKQPYAVRAQDWLSLGVFVLD